MAMELFVLSDRQLNSVVEWQAAIDGEGYPLRLAGDKPIEALNGFLRAQLRDTKTGFECNLWPAGEFMREMSGVNSAMSGSTFWPFDWAVT